MINAIKTFIKKYQSVLLAILSGLLIFVSFPKTNLYLFAWVSLIPLLIILSKKEIGLFKALLFGFFVGLMAYSGLLYWIYPTINYNTHSWKQAILCLMLLAGYMSVYLAIWSFLIQVIRPTVSVFRFTLFASSLWVTLEYIRTYLFTGFPWVLLGYSQWKFLPVIQMAEYTGVYGISFLIVWVNVGIFRLIKTKRWLPFLGLLFAFVFIVVFGLVRLNQIYFSSPPYITVAVLQGNIDQYKKWDTEYEKEIMQTYDTLVLDASKYHPDLIIWPETAVPGYLPSNAYMYSWVSKLAQKTDTYHLVGTPYYNGGMDYFNSMLLFGPEGEILEWHKKVHLVPFGEYIPYRMILEPYFSILNTLGDFTPGDRLSALSIKSVLWGTTICSENFFGEISRQLVKNGAEILTNHTNDAWYFKTSAPYQHFIMNIFRAIENRRAVIVCGNTGVSGVVEPSGFVSKEIPIFETTYFLTRVEPRKDISFYTTFGDLFSKACAIITVLMLMLYLIGRVYKKMNVQQEESTE
ncbi:MAG: apolipoprotein N-acyltransferase [Endomicrobiales bacterium]|nr:apolipoprotein N-acyltransferase [Endomicrobiales bacterium]